MQNLLSKQKDYLIRERSSRLILPSIKVRLLVLPDFWVPDVLNWFVQFMVQIKLIQEPLKVKGKEVKINSPLDAMKLGMAYLPEDRKAEGIIADLSVRENIIIALQAKRGMFHPLSKKEMEMLLISILNYCRLRQQVVKPRLRVCPVVTSRRLFLEDGF